MADNGAFCYEQPLNERIRTFLRLEHLIARLRHHEADESPWGRRATLDALIDILNVMSRYDTRAEVSKELGSRYAAFEKLADRDDVDERALKQVLDELDTMGRAMQTMPPQFASYQLRDNELLNSLNNRSPIAGGDCGFDLPAFQHWLSQKNADQARDLKAWAGHIQPFEQSISMLLRLLRESTAPALHTAKKGVLVHNMDPNTQLIRVLLDDARVFPEISAGRHRATIRFVEIQDKKLRVRQYPSNVEFRMACCRF